MADGKTRIDELSNTYKMASGELVGPRFANADHGERQELGALEQEARKNWLNGIKDGLEQNSASIDALLGEVQSANRTLAGMIADEKRPREILTSLTSAVRSGTKLVQTAAQLGN